MKYLHCIGWLFYLALSTVSCFSPVKENLKKTSSIFIRNIGTEPSTLHPIRSTDFVASVVQSYVLDSLLQRNLDTYKWESALAEKWKVSKDHLSFFFTLRPNLKWHDGRPLTSKDVAFSFNAYKDPGFGGPHHIPYYESIESVKILDKRRIRFKANGKYFGNLNVLATMAIMPEHIYNSKKKKNSKILKGSGPYILKRYDKGKQIILEQYQNWWGRQSKADEYRIKRIVLKFIQNENDQLIRMMVGDLDFINLTAESYEKKTSKPPWGETVLKREIRILSPSSYNYIGWNQKNPLFKDKKVRKALNYLMDRDLMNKKFQYGKSELARGPWYFWSDYADSSVSPIHFDFQKASVLLKEAGWRDTDKNSVLDKLIDNKKREFRFTLIFSNKDFEKYLTVYQQALRKSGIRMKLRFMDWSAFLKLIHEGKFSAVALGWSGGQVDLDPKQIWHSESSRSGGSNFISYSNPEVDRLIDAGRIEMDRNKRIKIFRKVYRLIAEDHPYLFIFNSRNQFYAYSKKMKMKKPSYNYGIGLQFWWINQ